ncbi:hypothetical protein, partial [Bradyrhizobium sp. 33ap4]|uniref:hypothetical protein n=1 Tax=Bradyrhizobium sp. 33ap4 TaxID=3061630 RepID=UPI00292D5B8A
ARLHSRRIYLCDAVQKLHSTMVTVNVIQPDSPLCTKSETRIFDVAPTQYEIDDCTYQQFFPVTGVSSSVIKFNISNLGSHYLDLSSTFLHMSACITRDDGDEAKTEGGSYDEVFPTNAFANSMFKNVAVYLGQTLVSNNELYAYRSILVILLHSSPTMQQTVHVAGLFVLDEPNKRNDNITSHGPASRYAAVKGSKVVDLMTKLNSDIFCQPKLMLPGVEIRIVFYQNSDVFRLISPSREKHSHTVEFKSMTLHVKRVRVTASLFLGHERQLQKSPAVYLLRGVDTKVRSLPQGNLDCHFESLYQDRLPSKLCVVLQLTESFQGALLKNPYNSIITT